MYQLSESGVSVNAVYDRRRKNARGAYPIRICVIYRRKAKYYSTGTSAYPFEWQKLPITTKRDLCEVREEVRKRFYLIAEIVCQLINRQEFSFENIDTELYKRTCPSYKVDSIQK